MRLVQHNPLCPSICMHNMFQETMDWSSASCLTHKVFNWAKMCNDRYVYPNTACSDCHSNIFVFTSSPLISYFRLCVWLHTCWATCTSTLKHWSRLPLPKLILLHPTLSQRMKRGWERDTKEEIGRENKRNRNQFPASYSPLTCNGSAIASSGRCLQRHKFQRFKSKIRFFSTELLLKSFHLFSVTYKGNFLLPHGITAFMTHLL